jgi:hypothetical protein
MLVSDPLRRRRLGAGAIEAATELSWLRIAATFAELYARTMAISGARGNR